MTLQIEQVYQTAMAVSRQIRDHMKDLTVYFIVHHEGQRAEALGLAGQQIIHHPAAETALHLMTKARHSEESTLIGMAVARQNIMMGLATRNSVLALCTLNVDQYETLEDVRYHAYHLAWHAIDALHYRSEAMQRPGGSSEIIVRRRNAMEIISANLRADVFASLICALQDDHEAIGRIGVIRGLDVLQTQHHYHPEYFPYVITIESVTAAIRELRKKNIYKKKHIETALRLTDETGKTFEGLSLKQWIAFSDPAQDMAWRGYTREQILSAAINTSENTYVRAIGYLVSEITGIRPASILEIRENYSPFADDEFNDKLHEKAVSDIFEDVIAQGLRLRTIDPFIETATRQNVHLIDGQVMGWCAAALQASGRAFDSALKNGKEPEAAARREFYDERSKTGWGSLKTIGKQIIRECRRGHTLTLENIINMCKDDKGASSMRKAIEYNLKDPAYQRALAASYDLRKAPAPRAPAPAVAPRAPMPAAPAYAPAAPALGRPVQTRHTAHTGHIAAQEAALASTDEQRE